MEKLLCIIGDLNIGGAETFLMKIYKMIDRTKYQMDFLVFSDEEYPYNSLVRELGGKVLVTETKEKNPIKSFIGIKRIVKEGKYTNVLKVSEYSVGAIDLFAAKLGGADNLLFRSTNGGSSTGKLKTIIHKLFMPFANKIITTKIAPSKLAAEFTFGKKECNKSEILYLNNGLDLNEFKPANEEVKSKLKSEFSISDQFIVLHVGRFSNQKNHEYVIDVFNDLQKKKDAVLLLVGDGELYNSIQDKVSKLNLTDKVRFLKIRKDVVDIMSISDAFILPSFYEGMPNVIIEAQSVGLPCLLSDTITREANIVGNIEYLSLSDRELWSEKIFTLSKIEYEKCHLMLKEKGYDMRDVCQKFLNVAFDRSNN